MKKTIFLLVLAALLCLGVASLAEEAQDISAQATFSATSKKQNLKNLTDRKWASAWQGQKGQSKLEINSPTPIHGLYICWKQEPRAFAIQTKQGGKWVDVQHFDDQYIAHQYYPLDGLTSIRLVPDKDTGKNFGIEELFLLGAGEVPGWVQRWQPTHEDADIMLLFAHPDDEVLFFGGTLPYYGAERGYKVVPAVFTFASPLRRSELLNSLWLLGITHYPVLGTFEDRYARDLNAAYKNHGTRKVNEFITGLIRQYKPEVIITHDVNGEYGHGVHRLMADAARKGIGYAQDSSRYPDSFEKYGTFAVQKLYLHLYKEKGRDAVMEMDWDQPLTAFGGKTGYEMAVEAYDLHLSQHRYEQYKVEPRDARHSSYRFGLALTTVGEDVLKNDFMENVVLPPAN